jgi:hypothetical protein
MKNYTEEDVRFILDNYIKNQNLCVRETGHSLSSIKLMLQNISATYGFINFGKGNPMYTRVADKFREENQIFDKPMSKKSFCMRFGVINE